MMRYMAIEAIKQDLAWMGGEYKTEPVEGLRTANEMLLIMGSSPLQMQKHAPTRDAAEQYVNRYLARVMASTDANDMVYQLDASRNYDPSPHLERITVPVMWINSADDFINPPELGIAEKMVKLMPNARFVLIPISDATRGHGTHTVAAVWEKYSDRADAGVGPETLMERPERFPAARICPHSAPILEVQASSRARVPRS